MHLVKGITILEGVGNDCNVYVIDNEILIDSGTGQFFSDMKKKIEELGDPKTIRTIVNTHCHFDHTGGDQKFRNWVKAEIAIHESDKRSLENGDNLADMFNESARIITVDRSLRGKDILRTKNFAFEVIHTPGHTPGSICLYDRSKKILISGDTLFSDGIGRTDFPGGSRDDMMKSLEKLSKLDINYLFPGHGQSKVGGTNFLIKQILSGMVKNEMYK